MNGAWPAVAAAAFAAWFAQGCGGKESVAKSGFRWENTRITKQVYSLAASSIEPFKLYAAGEDGVYVSNEKVDSWDILGNMNPVTTAKSI